MKTGRNLAGPSLLALTLLVRGWRRGAFATGIGGFVMNGIVDYVIVAVIFALMLIPGILAVRWLEKRLDHRFGGASLDGRWELEQRADKLERKMEELQQQYAREKKGYEREIENLKSQVNFLTGQLQATIKTQGVLESELRKAQRENERLRAQIPTEQPRLPLFPLLQICGDERYCEQDQTALRRAGVPYRPLEGATKRVVEDELQRRREDGTPYLWLLVSAHGSRDGIQLADGLARPDWWNRVLDDDIRVVFLANCQGPEVGDALAGLVRRVIVLYGDAQTDLVQSFVYTFFRAKMAGLDSDAAYRQAINEVPQMRAYTDIRQR